MKNCVVIIVLLLFPLSRINAQAGVTISKDPFNLAINKASKLLQAKQLTQLKENIKIYKEWRDTYKKVNSAVKQYSSVKDIYDTSKKLAASYQMCVQELYSNQYLSYQAKEKFMVVYTSAFEDSSKKVENMKNFVGKMFEMNDAERIMMLENILKGINDDYSFILYVRSKINAASLNASRKEKAFKGENELGNFDW